MNVSVDDVRKSMVQKYDPNTECLEPSDFFEQYKQKVFDSGDLAEVFHENSKYVEGHMQLQDRAVNEFGSPEMAYVQSNISPDYTEHERVDLPVPETTGREFEAVVENRRSVRNFSGESITLREVSYLLKQGCGVTGFGQRFDDGSKHVKAFRSFPSGGGLYPVEAYVGVMNGEDIRRGVYYYDAADHALRVLDASADSAAALAAAIPESVSSVPIADAGVVVVLTSAFARSKAKYGVRGYRYVLQESGHVAQNLYLAAEALGLGCVSLGGFYDDALNETLGIDGVNEAAIYPVVVGGRDDD